MIIHAMYDIRHAVFANFLYKFNLILCKLILFIWIFLRQYNQSKIREVAMANQTDMKSKSHMPKDSLFFEKIVPISLISLGVITLGLILFAAGVIFGVVHF